jgi:hypothetical protein
MRGAILKGEFMQESCLRVRELLPAGARSSARGHAARDPGANAAACTRKFFICLKPPENRRPLDMPGMGPAAEGLGSENYAGRETPASTGIVREAAAVFLPEETLSLEKKRPGEPGPGNRMFRESYLTQPRAALDHSYWYP